MSLIRTVLIVICLSAEPVRAEWLDWEDGTWVFGGGSQVGWLDGQISGTTATGFVTVTYLKGGTADGVYTGIGSNINLFAGFTGTNTDGAVTLATSGDFNTGILSNYVGIRLNFLEPRTLTFEVGDVDDTTGTAWQDYLTVSAFLTGSPVSVSYTPNNTDQTITNYLGQDGILGINNIDSTYAARTAIVTIAISSPVDQVEIYFSQGPQATSGSDHRIWVGDINLVPEPRTFALVVLGAFACWRRARASQAKPLHRVSH